jgi:GNAT superfamily N-acetyltransferase
MTRPRFEVRPATPDDAPALARHRVEMFRDMRRVPNETLAEELRAATGPVLREWLAGGTYLGWVARPAGQPGEIVGGAGVQLLPRLPRPSPGGEVIWRGPEAYVLNVYVERAWRRRGVASLLMQHVLADARDRGIATVSLHASADGRPLYERLGFAPTNELRLR